MSSVRLVGVDKAVEDGKSLFNLSPFHYNYSPEELQAYLYLPCKKNTIRLYYRGEEPIGLVTWCWFEPEEAKEFLRFNYLPQEKDYTRRHGTELWGLEFIAPYGDGKYIFSSIKKEYSRLYGDNEEVRWRRAKDPLRVHMKRFT